MLYRVATFREVGLQAKWGKVNKGRPAIFVRNPKAKAEHQRTKWWLVNVAMWNAMKKNGIVKGFDNCTALGDILSI